MTDHNEETRDQLEQDIHEAVETVDEGQDEGLYALDALIAERDEWRDRALRAAAEAENTKRRAETQANDARAYAIQRFAKDLLGVSDSLDRALQAAPRDADGVTGSLVTGLELVQKSLVSAFEANGLKRLAPEAGEVFDPHQHQAMMEQPSDTVAGGHVIQCLQPGFALFERTVRAAMVVVAARGSGGKAAPAGYAEGAEVGTNLDQKA